MTNVTEEIFAAGVFKAQCLKMMAQVERTQSPIVITKRGKPMVKIVPYVADDAPESAFGCMKGTAELAFDTTATKEHSLDDFILAGDKTAQNNSADLSDEVFDKEVLNSTNTQNNIEAEPKTALTEESLATSEIELENDPESHSEKESKRHLPIYKTPPPTRGLPIENVTHHMKSPALEEDNSEEELYIPPSHQEDEQIELASFEDEDIFLEEDLDDDDLFLIDTEDTEDEEFGYKTSGTPSPAADLKEQLAKRFTSAWNRKTDGDQAS
jgi:prevent-host-death family protein